MQKDTCLEWCNRPKIKENKGTSKEWCNRPTFEELNQNLYID